MKTFFQMTLLFFVGTQLCEGEICPLTAKNDSAKYGIKFGEKFDPRKQPVLFIHGLFSDSDTWSRMNKALQSDPDFVKNYQCWFYNYESGTPPIGAAALLKNELDTTIRNIEKIHGISMQRRLIVVGHSLGGILAKSLISDSGDQLWNAAFTVPVEELDLTAAESALLSTAFFYQPRTYVGKTIFMATPHQGSSLANGVTGKIASSIAPCSPKIANLINSVRSQNLHFIQEGSQSLYENNISSVHSLREDSQIRKILANLPIDREAEFHSISGIKRNYGKGDGVVPVKSTIVPGAYCEIGIFSRHKIHQKPEAFDLINLIIKTDFKKDGDDIFIDRLKKSNFAFARFRGKFLSRR